MKADGTPAGGRLRLYEAAGIGGPTTDGAAVPLADGPGDGVPPLFCLHTVSGATGVYVPLAATLGDIAPVIGVNAPGWDDWSDLSAVPDTVDGLAEAACRTIRAIQPAGPYRLCGYSMGGLIAWETARRLMAAPNAGVDLLVMIDSYLGTGRADAEDAFRQWLSFALVVSRGRRLGWADRRHPIWRQDRRARIEVLHVAFEEAAKGTRWNHIGIDALDRFFDYFDRLWRANRDFVPQPAPSRPIYYEAPEGRRAGFGERWLALAAGGERIDIAGTHGALMFEPYLTPIADGLRTRLAPETAR